MATVPSRSDAPPLGDVVSYEGDSGVVGQLMAALRGLESLQTQLHKYLQLRLSSRRNAAASANDEGRVAAFPKLLMHYEAEVRRLRQCVGFVHFNGREHVLREIQLHLEAFRSPLFQNLVAGWLGTPGVEEKWREVEQNWNQIDGVVSPLSTDAALRQLVQYAAPPRTDLPRTVGAIQTDPRFAAAGVLNFNLAHAGADAQAHQKSSQELQQQLQLTQTIEIAVAQEQRFKALLKDLNASAAELNTHIDQAQNAQQEVIDASRSSEQILTTLTAQNAAAQQIANEIQRDRGLSRSLLTACAALALCLGLPKLSFLIPCLKHVPGMRPQAETLEKAIHRARGGDVVANLIRERHIYKISYETLQDVAEIPQHGNLLHKLAFGILGLGRMIQSRLTQLPPPSDTLNEHERWIDQRLTPHGPPQWTKHTV